MGGLIIYSGQLACRPASRDLAAFGRSQLPWQLVPWLRRDCQTHVVIAVVVAVAVAVVGPVRLRLYWSDPLCGVASTRQSRACLTCGPPLRLAVSSCPATSGHARTLRASMVFCSSIESVLGPSSFHPATWQLCETLPRLCLQPLGDITIGQRHYDWVGNRVAQAITATTQIRQEGQPNRTITLPNLPDSLG